MERALQYVMTGISLGSLYALVALGVVLVYRANRILNFAHGEVTTVSCYVAFLLSGQNYPWWLAFAAAVLVGALLSLLFYWCVIIPAQRRQATHLGQVALTLGFALVLQGLILSFCDTEPQTFPFPLSESQVYRLGDVVISQLGLGALVVGVVGSLSCFFLVKKTRLGLAMQATSENLPAAQTLGIPTRRILALSWSLAAAFGVVAGLFLATALLIDPFYMLEPFFKGFAAAVLGGLNSLPGAMVGGILLGVAEALAGGFISVAFKNALAFLIIIIVLLIRPEGLLGKEFIERI
ncbi:MAG: branched-chain amino acid ABC transporter permease [Deltaproteobacteria bacterium]|nr:branched-chain amino acid ABC transporter permease [Deltaproteobacteria bacterium]